MKMTRNKRGSKDSLRVELKTTTTKEKRSSEGVTENSARGVTSGAAKKWSRWKAIRPEPGDELKRESGFYSKFHENTSSSHRFKIK